MKVQKWAATDYRSPEMRESDEALQKIVEESGVLERMSAAMDQAVLDDVFTAIDKAQADALVAHQAGTCGDSEWSCSHCENES